MNLLCQITSFSGSKPENRIDFPQTGFPMDQYENQTVKTTQEKVDVRTTLTSLPEGSHAASSIGNSVWQVETHLWMAENDRESIHGEATFRVLSGTLNYANVAVVLEMPDWEKGNYVLMPAAAYNGNRFRIAKKEYPPFIHEEDGIGPDMPTTITDVPHLSMQGPGKIHLCSGDMATPCIGFFDAKKQVGLLLVGEQDTNLGYNGYAIEECSGAVAKLRIESPVVREKMYQMANSEVPSDDCGASFQAGDAVTIRFTLQQFSCPSVHTLFEKYCKSRNIYEERGCLQNTYPLSAAFRTVEEKYNAQQWNKKYQYYMGSPNGEGTRFGDWQAGWCGNGMHTLPYLLDGLNLSKERSIATYDAVFGILQKKNGWIFPIFSGGSPLGDDFCHQKEAIDVMLIRKNADILYFAGKQILAYQEMVGSVPDTWLAGYRRLADAFVRLWKKNEQFGQFIDMENDLVLQGGTVSGGIAPGGLALAAQITGDSQYMSIAVQSAEYYIKKYLDHGFLNGGPGEILQNADSESAFGLLEALVTLYEITGDEKWLEPAEHCARQCASWCVSYDFHFPPTSTFGKFQMKTTGSVYANVQNKHSAPGICTLSGLSLLKLYRATRNRFYLELLKDTAHNITQYLSRPDRLIPTWESEGTTEPTDGVIQGNFLPSGNMCERVNMSDWETKKNIGEIFNGSCWCETSLLLTYSEVPGIWFLTDTGEAVVFDHVTVDVQDKGDGSWLLKIHNPTLYDADVKLYHESTKAFDTSWDDCRKTCENVAVPAGETVTVLRARQF